MFELTGPRVVCCDGIDRRAVLRLGALGLGGLTLPQLLTRRAEAARAGRAKRSTSVIFVELAGGPSHLETYDPKPQAPQEYRGPLGTAATNVPGVAFSELMQRQAGVMDKLCIIRSIHHRSSSHGTSAHLAQTGYYLRDSQNRENEMPCAGAIASRVRGANAPSLPAFVSLGQDMRYGRAAWLGKAFNPFVVSGDPNASKFDVRNLTLVGGLDARRLDDRRRLLSALDATRRLVDTEGVVDAMDDFTTQAFEMITSDATRRAFDLSSEAPTVREQYGRNITGQSFLLARRLIEAGVTFVTVRPSGSWDDHQDILRRMREKGPAYDQAMAALVTDLYQRGLDEQVMVVAMGEFGRTPRVNRSAGRDHWGSVMSVLMSGGGLKTGQVVGGTNSKGEVPADSPYRPENVLATVYRHLGIDPATTFADHSGRPRYVLEERQTIQEIV